MKTKLKSIIASVALIALVTGCANTPPKVTQAFVKSGVQLGVTFGVSDYPEAIPYLRFAAPIICKAAQGTNVQPAFILALLAQNEQANKAKNDKAVLIFNSAFGFYTGLYEAYGANGVQDIPTLQAWLSGTCEGIVAGLPPLSAPTFINSSPRVQP